MEDQLQEFIHFLVNPDTGSNEAFMFYLFALTITLCTAGLIIWGLLSIINSAFLPKIEGSGIIAEMYFEEAHYSTTSIYNAATKTYTPHTTYHPDAWRIVIDIDGRKDDMYVTDKEYIKLKVNQSIYCTYSMGRLWKSLYIKNVSL